MGTFELAIMELLLFFIVFPVTFKAMMAVDINRLFRRGSVWQIQLLTIFSSIIVAYLLTRAIMHLITLATTLIP